MKGTRSYSTGAPSSVWGKAQKIILVDNRATDNGLIRVEYEKNHTGRKRSTIAIRLGFLSENFFVKLSFQVYYRDSHTEPCTFVSFPSH